MGDPQPASEGAGRESCLVLGNPKSYHEWMTLALNWTLRNFAELGSFCAFGHEKP